MGSAGATGPLGAIRMTSREPTSASVSPSIKLPVQHVLHAVVVSGWLPQE